jgi:hypothetical protein
MMQLPIDLTPRSERTQPPGTPVHVTDMLTFQTCRRKWSWSSRLMMNLQPINNSSAFMFGTAMHYALEHYHSPQSDCTSMVGAVQQYFTDVDPETRGTPWRSLLMHPSKAISKNVALAEQVAHHYEQWDLRTRTSVYGEDAFETLGVEIPFHSWLTLPPGYHAPVFLEGKIDRLARHLRTGEYYIIEYKTARDIQERISLLPNDPQASMYMIGAQRFFGVPIAGVLYILLKKAVPKQLEPLKSGVLSTSETALKGQTVESYRAQIRLQHPTWSNAQINQVYGNALYQLSLEPSDYFERVVVTRTPDQLRVAEEHFVATALEMTNPATVMYPHVGWNCHLCAFKQPCDQFADRFVRDHILQRQFQPRVLDQDE